MKAFLLLLCASFFTPAFARANEPIIPVAAQPLAANVLRIVEAYDFLGTPLAPEMKRSLTQAAQNEDGQRLQELLEPSVLFIVELNPESRVKVRRGQARAILQQG